MQDAGIVGGTMYLCLGNGGDGSPAPQLDQSGVIVFGNDATPVYLTGPSSLIQVSGSFRSSLEDVHLKSL